MIKQNGHVNDNTVECSQYLRVVILPIHIK